MAGSFSNANSVINSEVGAGATKPGEGFVPALWSDEIVAAYKSNLVVAPLVTNMNHKGKKGDVIYIPSPTRGAASAKGEEAAVTLQQHAGSAITVNIDKHYEYSRLIEDIVDVQALSSLRSFYTDDAGYALAKQVDTDLVQLGRSARGGSGTGAYTKGVYFDANGLAGTVASPTDYIDNTSTVVNLNDAGIRDCIQYLDDQDTPMDQRVLVVPPSQRNALMGIARFTEQAFVGDSGAGNTIRNGLIGEVYGVPVYVSTNCDSATTSGDRIVMLFHKGWSVLVEQMSVRSQTQYKQEFLSDLMTSDTIYGVGEIRDGAMLGIAVPA